MNAGPGESDVMLDINTTPLIDVMLVLIIMLIITVPMQLHSVNLNLSAGNAVQPQTPPIVVTLDIDFDGTVLWNGQVLTDRAALEQMLRQAAAQTEPPEVHLRPNKLVDYKDVAAVMALAQRVGLTKLGLVGTEQFAH